MMILMVSDYNPKLENLIKEEHCTDSLRVDGDDFEMVSPPPPAKRFRAVYKFHEGSSSAVRKCIKMSTLM